MTYIYLKQCLFSSDSELKPLTVKIGIVLFASALSETLPIGHKIFSETLLVQINSV
jgi:hypothetical protein